MIVGRARQVRRALAILPPGVEQPEETEDQIRRDGQIRLWWDSTPVDLFFDYDDPKFSLIDLARIKRQLSDILNTRVDALTRRGRREFMP